MTRLVSRSVSCGDAAWTSRRALPGAAVLVAGAPGRPVAGGGASIMPPSAARWAAAPGARGQSIRDDSFVEAHSDFRSQIRVGVIAGTVEGSKVRRRSRARGEVYAGTLEKNPPENLTQKSRKVRSPLLRRGQARAAALPHLTHSTVSKPSRSESSGGHRRAAQFGFPAESQRHGAARPASRGTGTARSMAGRRIAGRAKLRAALCV